MSEVQIKECHNVRILADLTHSQDIETTIKTIREKTKNWSNIEKYEFLLKHKIDPLKISREVIDAANEVLAQQVHCDISELRKPWLKKICLVGDMRSGKSTMIEWFCELVMSIYSQDYKIFIIDSNSLQYNLDNLEPADIVIIITDDAVELQGSGQYMSKPSQKLAGKYYKIAHEYLKRTGKKKTFIIAIFATQRWKDLDPRFRSAHITIFKNVLNTPEENKFLYALFSEEDFKILENHTILRNFNLPEYGGTYAYFINAKYRGVSVFPLPKFTCDKIDVIDAKLGGVNEYYKIMDIQNQFYRDYGLKIRWDDIAYVMGNKKGSEGYRIGYKRWHKNNFSPYSEKFEEIIKDSYYLRQLIRKKPKHIKKRFKARNINEEIEKATGEEKSS